MARRCAQRELSSAQRSARCEARASKSLFEECPFVRSNGVRESRLERETERAGLNRVPEESDRAREEWFRCSRTEKHTLSSSSVSSRSSDRRNSSTFLATKRRRLCSVAAPVQRSRPLSILHSSRGIVHRTLPFNSVVFLKCNSAFSTFPLEPSTMETRNAPTQLVQRRTSATDAWYVSYGYLSPYVPSKFRRSAPCLGCAIRAQSGSTHHDIRENRSFAWARIASGSDLSFTVSRSRREDEAAATSRDDVGFVRSPLEHLRAILLSLFDKLSSNFRTIYPRE